MITFFIWFASFLCPNPNHAVGNQSGTDSEYYNTSNAEGDTGGETGNPPPPPPPPPHG